MLNLDNTAVVIVDVQGKLANLMHEKELFFQNIIKLIKGSQVLEIPILWNEQLPDKLGETIPEIKELFDNQSPFVKSSFSCCGNDKFNQHLTSLKSKNILLAGMETHVCVYQTALDLLESGYNVYLVADAVSSRTLENKQIGIEAIRENGASVTNVEMAFFEMLKEATGDKFKQIIKIVK